MGRRTNQDKPRRARGGRRRTAAAGGEFGRLFDELKRPLQPEFVVHAYATLAGNIMRRSWQAQPDREED